MKVVINRGVVVATSEAPHEAWALLEIALNTKVSRNLSLRSEGSVLENTIVVPKEMSSIKFTKEEMAEMDKEHSKKKRNHAPLKSCPNCSKSFHGSHGVLRHMKMMHYKTLPKPPYPLANKARMSMSKFGDF